MKSTKIDRLENTVNVNANNDDHDELSGNQKWQVMLIVLWVLVLVAVLIGIGAIGTYILMNLEAFRFATQGLLSWLL